MGKLTCGCAAVVVAVAVISGLPAPAAARETGEVAGWVTGDGGERLTGAGVTVTRDDGLVRRTAVADSHGQFQLRFMPPGRYRAEIALAGFESKVVELEVRAGETTRLGVGLRIGGTDEIEIKTRDPLEALLEDRAYRQMMQIELPPDPRLRELLEQETARALAFRRPAADGKWSLNIGFTGPVDLLDTGLRGRQGRGLEVEWLNDGWAFDPGKGTASGPPAGDVRLRFGATDKSAIPGTLTLEASLGGEQVFADRVKVAERPPVDPAKAPHLGLVEAIAAGDPIIVTSLEDLEAALEVLYPQAGGGVQPERLEPRYQSDGPFDGWELFRKELYGDWVPFSGLVPSALGSGPIVVQAVDLWGETLFRHEWTPQVLPAGLCAGEPVITGVSEVAFAGDRLCVCGCFAWGDPLGRLEIGGRPLGAPRGLSSYVAHFTTPADLAPGAHEVGWAAGAGGAGGPFRTEVIEIRARVNDEVIQKGGTTALEMAIAGTERQLPVTLENRSREKIKMTPSDSISTRSTGGSGNHVPGVRVTGLAPGDYAIDWKVDAGTCPCTQVLPEMARVWEEELDSMFATLAGGQPVAAGCPALPLVDDNRYRVEVEWRDPVGPSACAAYPNGGLFARPGSSQWETLVKMVDGCAVNGHYWVFFAANTDVDLAVSVTDTHSGQVKSYRNPPPGGLPAVTDTAAFATCP